MHAIPWLSTAYRSQQIPAQNNASELVEQYYRQDGPHIPSPRANTTLRNIVAFGTFLPCF